MRCFNAGCENERAYWVTVTEGNRRFLFGLCAKDTAVARRAAAVTEVRTLAEYADPPAHLVPTEPKEQAS